MKTQYFRIKKNLQKIEQETPNKQSTKTDQPVASNAQLSQLINLLHNYVTQNVNSSQEKQQDSLQPRDKHPIIPWSPTKRQSISDRQLQIWITNVCKTTFSTTFNYYYTDQFSYEQARVFCAQSIIKNVVRLTERLKLSSNQIKILDEYIQSKIIPYMSKKYPLTGQTDTNKAFENVVEEINSFDQLQNDFIYITGVKFWYRKSGNYNDLIMEVLNNVLLKIDETSKYNSDNKKSLSNMKDFQLTMTQIFQKVENIDWINSLQKENENSIRVYSTQQQMKIDQKERQKYSQKVKSYTNFLIGRKVNENVDLFEKNQIDNEHLVVKHSSILRILTKWCEELQGKYTKNYMKEHLQKIETLGGDINSLNDQHRDYLDEKLHVEMTGIKQYLKRLKETFYNQQCSQLLRHLQPDNNNYIEPYQKAFGKFSCQTVKNLHTYIIKYLNRLIHGLVKVGYEWHRQSGYRNNYEKWSYPPNLVTFKIGDLIRCKCSSKQKEILSIFNQLNRISTQNPNKMKIIRIKNRLRSQTNDILINVKFNNCLIGQIQLAVNTKKSKFAQCSNNFCHYLYELQRGIFGPFSELANIWKNIDIRSKQFESIIRSEGRAQIGIDQINRIEATLACKQGGHKFVSYDLPFRCTYCRNYHSHNDVIISNAQCLNCQSFKCMRCQIQSMSDQDVKLSILGKKYEQLGKKVAITYQEMPSYGFYVQTDSRNPKLQYFKQYQINGIIYYLGKKNNKIFRVVKNDEKSLKDFFYHNLVFKLKQQTNEFIKMTNSQVKESFILPEYVNSIYKSEKQSLFLNQKKISPQGWPTILNNQKYANNLLSIKKVQISNNNLTNIEFIADIFPNLQSIQCNSNIGCQIGPLTKLNKIKEICINLAQLNEIPKSIANLQMLEQLNIYKNKVSVLPKELFTIKSLKILNLKYNSLTQLPQQLAELTNLNELLLRGNNLKSIPDCISKLSSLTILNIGKCGLKSLNPNIGKITSLKILDIVANQLHQIPQTFANLTNLQKLKMQENNLTVIPQFISNFTKLKQFALNNNKLNQVSLNFKKLKQLDSLNISNNNIRHIDSSITSISTLKQLYLHDNKYKQFEIFSQMNNLEDISFDAPEKDSSSFVPKEICFLNNLLTLKIKASKNKLLLTPSIKYLNQLEEIFLQDNGLLQVPKEIILIKSLQKVSFQNNLIDKFPVQYLNHLYKLEELHFRGNKFKKVQKELISRLQVLDFTNNQITQVQVPNQPNDILKKLKLRENMLKTVPNNLSQLKKLKQLDLSFNKILTLDQDLAQLRNMEYLSFHIYGNPIQSVRCQNFIENQMCDQSKLFINSLVLELVNLNE